MTFARPEARTGARRRWCFDGAVAVHQQHRRSGFESCLPAANAGICTACGEGESYAALAKRSDFFHNVITPFRTLGVGGFGHHPLEAVWRMIQSHSIRAAGSIGQNDHHADQCAARSAGRCFLQQLHLTDGTPHRRWRQRRSGRWSGWTGCAVLQRLLGGFLRGCGQRRARNGWSSGWSSPRQHPAGWVPMTMLAMHGQLRTGRSTGCPCCGDGGFNAATSSAGWKCLKETAMIDQNAAMTRR